MTEHTDVVIIGAGLSGIGAAAHLAMKCPDKRVVLLEARQSIGGTWDLFRYPGIRSDSDMYTFGFTFKPWIGDKTLADGPSIMAYLREVMVEHDIERKIRFGMKVKRASWSTADSRWTLDVESNGSITQMTCDFVYSCTGYYDYAGGHDPQFEGRERFRGTIVHPQKWPESLDYAGKKVVVIGSGATAVTVVPEMAKTAAHVTMLQRSPTYVGSVPSKDRIAHALRKRLPPMLAYQITRWKNVAFQLGVFNLSRKRPAMMKKFLLDQVQKALGPDYDVKTHFTPRYNPWDERLCAVPDGDLFEEIKAGRASVVTDHIERFDEKGIVLKSGKHLDADIIVTATGLKILFLGGIELFVDGQPIRVNEKLLYKGIMLQDVPNLAITFGYTNASWTLKADLTAEYVCRLLEHMKRNGIKKAVATPAPDVKEQAFLTFSSGYIQRAKDVVPKQGDKAPWKLYMNYALDTLTIRRGRIEDGTLQLTRAPRRLDVRTTNGAMRPATAG
jgi:cation diffusion facilitator CzcD-associated flavoprotein CzcO